MAFPSLRYVVLRHEGVSEPHFDLLFETLPGSMLAAWRVPAWPIETPTTAQRLREHRRLYLEYEGILTDQRGQVYRVAEGACNVVVGERDQWTLALMSGVPPQKLLLRPVQPPEWEVSPA